MTGEGKSAKDQHPTPPPLSKETEITAVSDGVMAFNLHISRGHAVCLKNHINTQVSVKGSPTVIISKIRACTHLY